MFQWDQFNGWKTTVMQNTNIWKETLEHMDLPDCLRQESRFQELFVVSQYQNLSRQQSLFYLRKTKLSL